MIFFGGAFNGFVVVVFTLPGFLIIYQFFIPVIQLLFFISLLFSNNISHLMPVFVLIKVVGMCKC